MCMCVYIYMYVYNMLFKNKFFFFKREKQEGKKSTNKSSDIARQLFSASQFYLIQNFAPFTPQDLFLSTLGTEKRNLLETQVMFISFEGKVEAKGKGLWGGGRSPRKWLLLSQHWNLELGGHFVLFKTVMLQYQACGWRTEPQSLLAS